MPYIETYYDYDIHKECFRVSEAEKYTHTTDTLFNLDSIDKSLLPYMTATFNLDVIRNIGDGKVGIYDGDSLITIVDFNENDTAITDLELELNYEIDHALTARYYGNDECLPSKSKIILLNEPVPDGFASYMTVEFGSEEVTTDEFSYPTPAGNTLLEVTMEDEGGSPLANKTITLFISNEDGETSSETLTTNSSGYADAVFYEDYGIYNIKILYGGDTVSLGTVKEFKLYYGYLVTITPNKTKWLVGEKPKFEVLATTYDGTPLEGITVTLWEEEAE